MGDCGTALSTGQNELGEGRQFGVVRLEGLIERHNAFRFEQLKAGDAEFAAEVEEVVLNLMHKSVDRRPEGLATQQAER